MSYLVHSDEDRRRLLEAIGAADIDELFSCIPAPLRVSGLDLPPGLSELETRVRVEALAQTNRVPGAKCFLGGGCYRHHVPAAIRALISRGEFLTAYTPYQPEASQGTLQFIFEFQTCICELTGMEVANASLYDGPSALAEAALMALRLTGRTGLLVSRGVHPEALAVVRTYASGPDLPVRCLPLDDRTGTTVAEAASLGREVGAVLVQQPNCLGVVEDLPRLADVTHAAGALLVVCADPSVLGVLEAPGHLGADLVVGDAGVFGNPPSFGGPSVGFLACRQEHLRQLPGRLVGQTVDREGRRCFALTLQAREQHIRRARATSNVCSNHSLSALAATIHLALLGPKGLQERGEICLQRAHYLQSELCRLPGVHPLVSGPFFHEFALQLPLPARDFCQEMRKHGVEPGVPLETLEQGGDPVLEHPSPNALLVAVTELNPPEALAAYVEAARKALLPSSEDQERPNASRKVSS